MRAASPSREDVEKEFGRDCVVSNPDGTWEARVRGPERIQRAVSMLDGVRQHDRERGERVQAAAEKTTLVHRDSGRTLSVRSDLADRVARKHGMVERERRSPTVRGRFVGGRLVTYRNVPGKGWVEED